MKLSFWFNSENSIIHSYLYNNPIYSSHKIHSRHLSYIQNSQQYEHPDRVWYKQALQGLKKYHLKCRSCTYRWLDDQVKITPFKNSPIKLPHRYSIHHMVMCTLIEAHNNTRLISVACYIDLMQTTNIWYVNAAISYFLFGCENMWTFPVQIQNIVMCKIYTITSKGQF